MIQPESVESEAELKNSKPRVWGPWATVGFGIVIIVVSIIVQAIIAVIFFLVTLLPRAEDFADLDYTKILQSVDLGLLISLSIIISAIVCVGLIAILVKVRRGATFAGYLGLHPIRAGTVFVVLSISVGYIALSFLVNWALNIPQETDVMTEAYATSIWPALFWIAVIIFAPLFEEVL